MAQSTHTMTCSVVAEPSQLKSLLMSQNRRARSGYKIDRLFCFLFTKFVFPSPGRGAACSLICSVQAGSFPFYRPGAWGPEVHPLSIFTRTTDNGCVILRLVGSMLETSCQIEILLEGILKLSWENMLVYVWFREGQLLFLMIFLQENLINTTLLTQQHPQNTNAELNKNTSVGLKALFKHLGPQLYAGAGLILKRIQHPWWA